ncbi:MAG: glycoside hydrolase family 88 protein [Chitinispirillaceae bacterium]|nr:glycoside hydrolase family 88 protein [Chitinispirillaceae bacterium]
MSANRLSNLPFFRHAIGLSLVLTAAVFSTSDTLPQKAQIINQIRRVNDYWMLRNPDYGTNEWDRATYYSGLVPLYTTLHQQHHYDYAVNWATQHNWELNGGVSTRHADNHCAGQAYIMLHAIEPAAQRIAAISESIRLMVAGSKIDDWWWCDALHMAPPVFAALGILQNDDAYFSRLHAMWNDTKVRRRLWCTTDHLWFRDETYLPPNLTPGGKHIHWSRGNGWVFAGLAKVLSILPQNAPGRDAYITEFREMAAALRQVQRNDGFWNSSLVDPDQYGGPEASGTSFFTFGMAWGINNGYLGDTAYLPVAARAWNALNGVAVHPDGMLGYCQAIAAGPGPSSYNDTKDYAVGAFVLAGCELLRLAPGTFPDTTNLAPGTIWGYSSQQDGNEAGLAVDGSLLTRWSAQGYPQWIEIDLGQQKALHTIELHFLENRAYRYTLQTRFLPEQSYTMLVDSTDNTTGGKHIIPFNNHAARHIRLTITGASGYSGDWVSVSDMRVLGGDLVPVIRKKNQENVPDINVSTLANGAIVLDIPATVPPDARITYALFSLAGKRVMENTVPAENSKPIILYPETGRGIYLLQYRIGRNHAAHAVTKGGVFLKTAVQGR